MVTLIFGLWVVITGTLTHATYSYEDCKALEFQPKACITAELVAKIAPKEE
jgi:hypothetical protein